MFQLFLMTRLILRHVLVPMQDPVRVVMYLRSTTLYRTMKWYGLNISLSMHIKLPHISKSRFVFVSFLYGHLRNRMYYMNTHTGQGPEMCPLYRSNSIYWIFMKLGRNISPKFDNQQIHPRQLQPFNCGSQHP